MPSVFGMEPTASRQCEPVTVRPSVRVTITSSPSRRTACARDFPNTVRPRRAKTSSSTWAASASSPGQHPVARGDQHDLGAEGVVRAGELGAGHPRADHDQPLGQLGQLVDLGPGEDPFAVGLRVGQHPRDARRWRSAPGRRRRTARRRRSRRSPAPGRPAGRDRGRRRCRSCGAALSMSSDWRSREASTRRLTAARSTRTSSASCSPSSPESCVSAMTSAVAIRVLDGTQSVSTAEPPIPSVSIRVTSPPSCWPTSAAS